MSKSLTVTCATIHDCARVEVLTDHENGCVQILCYNENKKAPWHEFDLTIFGLNDDPPQVSEVTHGAQHVVA